jgi:hypothetical protein
LVNDRRAEAAYLRTLLADSIDRPFTPELRRNLQTVQSLGVSLKGSVDPALGRANERQESIDERESEINDLRLQLLRLQAQKLVDDSNAKSATQLTSSENAALEARIKALENKLAKRVANDTARKTANEAALEKQVVDLKKQLEKAQTDLKSGDATAKPGTPETDVVSTPLDEFRDRQTYRRELRAALAEVSLDDLHDSNGNSLYRLQFRATVLPGAHADQWGIARLTIMPPVLKREDYIRLYASWLEHLSHRLNRELWTGDIETDAQYELLASQSGLFEIARIDFNLTKQLINQTITLRPGLAATLISIARY